MVLLDKEPEAGDVRAIGGAAPLHLQTAHESSAVGSLNQGHQLIPEPSPRRCGNHAIADCCQGYQEKKPPQEAGDDERARQWQQHFALLCFLTRELCTET
jgi:hypothetical protein